MIDLRYELALSEQEIAEIVGKSHQMTFHNLTTNSVEEYNVNIVEDIDYIQRFNLGHIEQIPELALEIYADIYDKEVR